MVLGVLLALQLDNWNTERQEKLLFGDYVEQLILDLREDQRFALFVIESSTAMDDYARYLLEAIETPDPGKP